MFNARPAGMSDEESDEEGFYFHDEIPPGKNNISFIHKECNESKPNGEINFNDTSIDEKHEKQALEFQVLEACMSGRKDIINDYLSSGRNVNEFLHTGWTLLLYASSAAQTHIVKHLLELGANPNLHKDGFTPVMALSNCPRGTNENCLACLKLLIEARADVNATSKRRETALMYACKMRESEFVLELLKNMNTVNASDSEGQTALFYAVKANRIEIVEMLIEYNADICVKDRFSATPYDIAKTKGFDKILALLDTEGVDEAPVSDSIKFLEWRDMFPALAEKDAKKLDFEIATILYGMGLDRYKELFKGMNLKTLLKLTEEDLEKLGMDISVHRKRFIEDLHRFHTKKWDLSSLGTIKKTLPYTIYDGVLTLGNAAKQISIVGASFRFIKNSLMRDQKENLDLSPVKKVEYKRELQKSQDSLVKLKKELILVEKLAEKIDKDDEIKTPATYIAKNKKSYSWTIVLSVSVMVGMLLSKMKYAQKLWND